MGDRQTSNGVVLAWAEALLHEANASGAPMRALGGIGIYLKCPEFRPLIDLCRPPLSDVDLITARRCVRDVVRLFAAHRFEENLGWRTIFGHQRRVFYTPENLTVELFIDRLYFCQEIDLRNRLVGPGFTLSATDLFFSRIQKIGLVQKDFVDLSVLLAAHEVDGPRAEAVDLDRIVQVAGRSWRWWKTLTLNLAELQKNVPAPLREHTDLQRRLGMLRAAVQDGVRSLPWKFRALLGERLPWYRLVD